MLVSPIANREGFEPALVPLRQRGRYMPRPIAINPAIADLLGQHAAVAIGVSGGKDSQAAAIATVQYLDRIGHTGPRLLIQADLGAVEWGDSLLVCERRASLLGVELVVVRWRPGGLMQRWESRWYSNIVRYEDLSTVTLVPCWSTPALRFCTSELKTSQIDAELGRRFKRLPVISIVGVRRQESRQRARAKIADRNPRNGIWTWRPILDWTEAEVFDAIDGWRVALHPAYRQFGMTRVSCRFCIMSSLADLKAASRQPEAHDLYRRMVELECRSTFAFQGARWLGDIAPHLLDPDARDALAAAKETAARRVAAERRIIRPMLYVKGWPTRMLSDAEAELLAEVRAEISGLLRLNARFLDRDGIHGRYAELLATKATKARGA